MKRLALIVVLACCLMAGCGRRVTGEEKQATIDLFEANSQKEFVGTPAPDFSLPDLQGNIVSLSQIAPGKHIVLDFWGSWCGFCVAEFPEMKRYYERYRSRMEFVGINVSDTPAKWQRAVKRYELPWTQLRDYYTDDPEASPAFMFGVSAFPTTIVLAPDRTILHIFKGEGPELYDALDALFQ